MKLTNAEHTSFWLGSLTASATILFWYVVAQWSWPEMALSLVFDAAIWVYYSTRGKQ